MTIVTDYADASVYCSVKLHRCMYLQKVSFRKTPGQLHVSRKYCISLHTTFLADVTSRSRGDGGGYVARYDRREAKAKNRATQFYFFFATHNVLHLLRSPQTPWSHLQFSTRPQEAGAVSVFKPTARKNLFENSTFRTGLSYVVANFAGGRALGLAPCLYHVIKKSR